MERISVFIRNCAPTAAAVAIVAVGLLAASPMAFAQSCLYSWTHTTVYAQPGGSISGTSGTLYVPNLAPSYYYEEYATIGSFSSLQVGYGLSVVAPKQLIPIFSNSPINVSFTATVPTSAMDGQVATVTLTLYEYNLSKICSSTVTVVIGSTCSQPVIEWNSVKLPATWNGATGYCYVKAVAPGATPFIWNNAYYVDGVEQKNECPPGTTWDTANCMYMKQPPGGFLWQNGFYTPNNGGSCPTGTTPAGANCLWKTAPWGTEAFVYTFSNGVVYWYFTSQFTCPDGGWDGAHCYIGSAPPGTTALIYNNAFYYN